MNSFGVFCLKVFVILLCLQLLAMLFLFIYDQLGHMFRYIRKLWRGLGVFLSDSYWWVVYRTTKRHHVVRIRTLEPNYWDTDTQILHVVMGLVVDHVELGLSAAVLNRGAEKLALKEWLWMVLPVLVRSNEWIRSRSRGLEYLSWEKNLGSLSMPLEERSPQQAQAAKILEEVYLWWTDVRPNRKSAEDLVNWDKHVERRKLYGGSGGYFNVPQFILDEEKAAIDEAIKIEQDYQDEDKKMIKKIVDILPYIWI